MLGGFGVWRSLCSCPPMGMAHMSLKTVRRVHTRAAATPVAAFGIYAGRRSQEKFGWQPIDTAPIDRDVMLIVTDGQGEP